MTINKNLCKHIWKFATVFTTSGYAKPKQQVVLFCEKCTKLCTQEAKEK